MTDEGRFSRLSAERRELLKLLLQEDNLPVEPIRRAAKRDRLPLSFVQERMWIAERFAPAGAYTTCIDIRGRLDSAVLAKALDEIVRRHEILRTTFDADSPIQTVHEPSSVELPFRDLRALPESTRDEETRRFLEKESALPFDLVEGPLLRFSLFRLEEERHLVVTSIHHLIFDGWSAGVFNEELAALYEAFARGEGSPLPELPIQYGDFALWQRDWAQGDAIRSQVSYWKRQLGGALPPLLLPRDRPPPETRTFESASLDFQLPPELHREVERLSRDSGVTPFMTLLAVLETLLHLSTGQEDIVVGSPVANRNPVQTEKLMGCFMQPLVLRCDLSGEPTFREVMARLRRVCLDAYAHQDAPFELVVRELRPRWDGGHLPLFQVLFNVQRARLTPERRPGFVMTSTLLAPASGLDLSLHLWTGGEAIEGMWDYSTELFDRETVEWLARGYRSVLQSVVEDADRKISTLGKWDERSETAGSGLSKARRELAELLLAEGAAADRAIRRLPRNGNTFEASFGQERLWFFEQLDPGGAIFRESVALRLEGPLDVEILERSWLSVTRRQESLRTSFVVEAGRPRQRIGSRVDFRVPVVDLSGLSADEQMQPVEASLVQAAEKPFDLSRAPLMRLVLLRLRPEEHVLFSTAHHIIADGWSGEVWQREMTAVYDAYRSGKAPRLPELEIQYADYAVWQRERMRGPWVHEELAYWKRTLGGELPVLELPVDRQRVQGGRKGRSATEAFDIPVRVSEQLRALGTREGTTLFMTLLAAYQALLHRYTGEEDILVDTVLAGRNRRELEGLVGFFVNSAILRTDASGNPTFRELLERVKRVCLGALEHQEVPFDRVVSELGAKRNTALGMLTPVSFMLHEAAAKPFEMGSVRVSRLALEPNDEFDLTMFVWQEREGLTGQLKYDRELFEAETIGRMAERWVRLLLEVAREPEVRLSEIALLSEEERGQILEGWNETREEVGERECIHERFESSAEESGGAIAVRLSRGMREEGKEYELSYEELERRANRVARSLRKRGVRAETRVGLCVGRSLELMVGMLGILKSGGAYVSLDASQPRERLKKVMEDSRVDVVVTRKEEREKLGELLMGLAAVEVEQTSGESGERMESGVGGENAAYVVYTSGTTGEPKGVVVSHGNVVNHNVSVSRRFGLRGTDRVLQFHTVSFDAAVEEIFPTWMTGGTLVMRGEELLYPGEELERLIEEEELTVLNLPTAYWQEWVLEGERRKRISVSGLRLLVVGGDKASAARYGRWLELSGGGVKWVNTYGPTETTVVSSLYEPEGGDVGEVSGGMSIGRPIGNTRMYVLDPGMEPVPEGVGGELWVGGAGVARGYLGRPELTAERFAPDPFVRECGARMYRTGDRARHLRDGRVEFLGRVDEQVKIRGFRVEPAEIESTLRRHRGVRNAVVLPVAAKDDRDAERRLFAFVIAAEDHRVTAAELREYLSDRLPHYMVPAGFVLVDRFASTPGGKIDRLALARRADPSRASEENYMAPRTSTEVELAGIWSELLGLPRIGIHDDFFALGGHSLLAARALARVRSRFQVELSLRELFLHPTIAGVAQATDLALATGKSAPMTELDLERETELDDSIGADGGVFQFPAQPARVFLTGATGFVGAFLLRELLDEMDAEVYCLVRAVSPDDGARKLRGSLEKYGLWEETTGARIVAVPGDLSEPGLGLSDEQFAVLGRDVEVIYHNGAWVNTLYPYPMLKAANVEGTREVLRLACHRRIKPVHYVSTLSVFPAERWTSGVMEERWNVDGGNSLHGGYAQSKWVAERLVSKAAARGIPVSTYRLGRVSGDSRTGVWLPDPVLIDFLQTLLDVGSLPRLDDDSPVDLIPVDYVTRAMVHLSRQSESLGKIFHLVNPEPLVWREFIDRVRGLRSPLRELTPEQWGAEVLRFARRNPDSFLHPLVPLLPSDVAARLDSAGEPAPERIAPARSGAAVPRLRVDCANTLQGLKDSGLACPPAGALLEMYFSYFVRSGMLKIRA